MCFSKYTHALLNLTSFGLLEDVGRKGRDLSAGPDNQWGAAQRSLSAGWAHSPLSVHPEPPVQAAARHLLALLLQFFSACLLQKQTGEFIFLGLLGSYLLTEKEGGWTGCF